MVEVYQSCRSVFLPYFVTGRHWYCSLLYRIDLQSYKATKQETEKRVNTPVHEPDALLATQRIAAESKAREVLAGRPSFSVGMLVVVASLLFVGTLSQWFADAKGAACAALAIAAVTAGQLWSTNRRLEAAITLLRSREAQRPT
jgi:hypothetical protein